MAEEEEHEATMEEILSSIRRIILEDVVEPADGESTSAAPAAPALMQPETEAERGTEEPEPEEETEAEEDVLDLTEVLQEEGTVVSINREAAPEPAPAPQAPAEPALAPSPVAPGSAADAFAARSQVVHATGIPMGNTERTLEYLIRELLRPILAEWLDKNLTPIVTREVEREISRLLGRMDKD